MIHWSQNQSHLVVFHGTHIKNVPHILANGINNKDPKTGMVSVAIGSHAQDIAYGYAAMSGEHGFRQAGGKATTVPHKDRAIITAHLPMEWVRRNVDRNFGGNPLNVRQRLADPELHTHHVVHTGSDFSPTETPELRFKEAIPAKYIQGWTQKGQKMKSFKEFTEETSAHQTLVNAGYKHVGDQTYLKKKTGHTITQNGGFFSSEPYMKKTKVFSNVNIAINHDLKTEEVAANAMSAQSPSAIANPGTNQLFSGVRKRFLKKRKDQLRQNVGE